ncbi:hypothetical protein DPV78_003159 [Talaromyces pinophilus]|nr:hypothetical protein DPV78_003159 [Talaromyces pinophilus]
MVVSTNSVPDDDCIDSDEFQEMLNAANPRNAPEAIDEDEDSTEEFERKPRIPRGWADSTNHTRQLLLLIGRLYDGHPRPTEHTYTINHSHFEIYFRRENRDLKQRLMVTLQLSPYGTRDSETITPLMVGSKHEARQPTGSLLAWLSDAVTSLSSHAITHALRVICAQKVRITLPVSR